MGELQRPILGVAADFYAASGPDIPEHDTDYQHDKQIDRAMDAAERHNSQGHDQ